VDDVSLRRIEAAPRVVRQTIDVRAPEFESLLPWSTSVRSRARPLPGAGVAPRDTEPSIQARTRHDTDPRCRMGGVANGLLEPKGGGPLPFHILGTGLDLFAQLRILSGTEARIVIRTTPAKESGAGIASNRSPTTRTSTRRRQRFRIPPTPNALTGLSRPARARCSGRRGSREIAAARRRSATRSPGGSLTASGDPPAQRLAGIVGAPRRLQPGTPPTAARASCASPPPAVSGSSVTRRLGGGGIPGVARRRSGRGHMPFLQQRPGWTWRRSRWI